MFQPRNTSLLIAALLSAACGSNGTEPSPTGADALVRLFHGAAGAGTASLQADGIALIHGIGYGSLTQQVGLASGQYDFRVTAGTHQATRTLQLTEGSTLTLQLTLTGGQLQLSASADTGKRQMDRANLRIISAPEVPRAPGDSSATAQAGVLDVYITAPGADLAGATARMSLDTGVPTYSTFLYFAPGQLQVRFTTRGTKTVVAQAGPIAFAAGDARAVVIRRAAGGTWNTSVEDAEEAP